MNKREKLPNFLLVFVLILFQVILELMLPLCTADMINIGIGQSGIEDVLPETISKTGMSRLMLLMTTEEQQQVLTAYQEEEKIYRKKSINREERDAVLAAVTAPMVAVYALTTDGADYEEVLGEDLYVPRDVDAFMILGMLPYETRMDLTLATREQIRTVSQSLISQAAINFIRDDMELQGIDVEMLQRNYLLLRGILMVIAAVGAVICGILVSRLSTMLAAQYSCRVREQLFEHFMNVPDQEILEIGTASITSGIMEDTERLKIRVLAAKTGCYAIVMAAAGSVLALLQNPIAGRFVILSSCLMMLLTTLVFLAAGWGYRKIHQLTERMLNHLRSMIAGMMTIRVFGTGNLEKQRFEEESQKLEKWKASAGGRTTGIVPVILLFMNLSFVFIAQNSTDSINQGTMQAGGLVACFQIILMIAAGFLAFSGQSVLLAESGIAKKRLQEMYVTTARREENKKDRLMPENDAAVVFQNVSLQVPDNKRVLLKDVSFSAEYGTVTAIVGDTGSGKTSLLNLLTPGSCFEGTIWLEGKDIADYEKTELCEKIGFVTQQPILLSGTIRENLKWRKQESEEKELWKAVEIAQAKEFLQNEKEGLESKVLPGAKNYSGGQKQRICIAQALVGNPQILVFDDCFTGLDRKTSKVLWENIVKEFPNAAILVSTRDEMILQSADQILYLQQGKLKKSQSEVKLDEK